MRFCTTALLLLIACPSSLLLADDAASQALTVRVQGGVSVAAQTDPATDNILLQIDSAVPVMAVISRPQLTPKMTRIRVRTNRAVRFEEDSVQMAKYQTTGADGYEETIVLTITAID